MQDAVISFPMFGEKFEINPLPSFSVFGFPLYWYGVIIALGCFLGTFYGARRSREFGIKSDDFIDVLLLAIPLGIVGARLYYVIFNFSEFSGDLLRIFNTRTGGLAIYGGVIGAAIAVVIMSRRKKISVGAVMDLGALGLLIGQSIGRWGNFINREVYGYETDIFCRMGLALPGYETIYVHPLFLYESLLNCLGFILLHVYTKKKKRSFDGQIFLMYVAWYGLVRMILEGMRIDVYSLYLGGIRVSQLLGGLSMAAAVLLTVVLSAASRKKGTVLWSESVANPERSADLPEDTGHMDSTEG